MYEGTCDCVCLLKEREIFRSYLKTAYDIAKHLQYISWHMYITFHKTLDAFALCLRIKLSVWLILAVCYLHMQWILKDSLASYNLMASALRCIRVHVCVCVRVCLCVGVCKRVLMDVYICVCMHGWNSQGMQYTRWHAALINSSRIFYIGNFEL